MKFRVGQFIRHVNGVKQYLVHSVDTISCVYGIKEPGSPVVDYYAATHVDRMYRPVMCGSWEKDLPGEEEPPTEPEVITEYEVYCHGATCWTCCNAYMFPKGHLIKYTGRTRKVVVQ